MPSHSRLMMLIILIVSTFQTSNCEELKDVWHYDLGVARISNPINQSKDQTEATNNSSGLSGHNDKTDKATSTTTEKTPHARVPLGDVCDFQGRHLKVAVSQQPPFVSCLQDLYGDWLCNGSNIELIHVFEGRLNFKADWVVIDNNHLDEVATTEGGPTRNSRSKSSIGGDRQDGKRLELVVGEHESKSQANLPQSSGIFSLVATGRVLLSANGVMERSDRSEPNLILSEPFDSFKLHFLLSKSVRDHDHIFIKPFNPQAWLAILSSATLIVPILYLINSTTAYYALHDDTHLQRHVTLRACWEHFKRSLWKVTSTLRELGQRSGSMSSSDLSLDQAISRMMIETSALTAAHHNKVISIIPSLAFPHQMIKAPETTTPNTLRTPLGLRRSLSHLMPVRGETKRKRNFMRRQWAHERKKARRLGKLKRKSGFFNLAYVVWYVVASLANQGGETEDLPRANSTRILIAFWWLYMIVICAIHSGILTAILTFPRQNDFIQTLDDYLNLEPSERSALRLSVDKYSELAHLLINSDNLHKSPLQLLTKHQHQVPIAYVNFQRHRQRILDEVQLVRSAFIEEKSTITQIISQEYYDSRQTKCLFKASRYPIDVIPMSLILSKRMSRVCIQSINSILGRIMRTGLAQKWRRKYESLGNDCLNTVVINAGDVDKIELKHVTLAFWLLAAGVILGLFMLVLEIVWLFTIADADDDDDDNESNASVSTPSDESSSSLSSGSNESDRVKLGFRRALMPTIQQTGALRSLRPRRTSIRRILKRTRRNQRRRSVNMPKITFSMNLSDDDDDDDDNDHDQKHDKTTSRQVVALDESGGIKEVREFHARRVQERRERRLTERRARRIQKTLELVKRVHGGKIYSDRQPKGRVHRIMGGNSVASRFPMTGSHSHNSKEALTDGGLVRRRLRKSSGYFGGGRVAPM